MITATRTQSWSAISTLPLPRGAHWMPTTQRATFWSLFFTSWVCFSAWISQLILGMMAACTHYLTLSLCLIEPCFGVRLPCRRLENLTTSCWSRPLHYTPPESVSPVIRPSRIWLYNKADFEKINKVLSSTYWSSVSTASDINQAWTAWKNIFMSVIDKEVPSHLANPSSRVAHPWIDAKLKALIKQKRSAW